jgi:hypothetical protein
MKRVGWIHETQYGDHWGRGTSVNTELIEPLDSIKGGEFFG